MVENLLGSDVDVNAQWNNYSALMIAAQSGSVSGLQMLIDHGAKINEANAAGITALWLAVPDYNRSEFLLEYGADPKLRLKDGSTLITKLVSFPHSTRLFDLLIARGAEFRNSAGQGAMLFCAAGTGDTSLTSRLLAAGFNPNDSVGTGEFPLIHACMLHHTAIVQQLVAYGADVNRAIRPWSNGLFAGMTPLMMAALSGDTSTMKFLLEKGANINARSAKGWTALLMLNMADTNQSEMTGIFLRSGADPAFSTPERYPLFYYASQKTTR